MFNGRVDLIRPMLDIWEDEVGEYAAYRNYGLHRNKCQHENNTQRLYVDQILRNLSKDFPAAKANIFKAMGNSYPEYLPLFKTI
jgi:tRNA(Ile)-lysidine synthase TilS/MesJ